MKVIQLIQKLSFLSILVFGTGESLGNLIAVCISTAVLGLTTLKLGGYGV